jgi:hypothetical protein
MSSKQGPRFAGMCTTVNAVSRRHACALYADKGAEATA